MKGFNYLTNEEVIRTEKGFVLTNQRVLLSFENGNFLRHIIGKIPILGKVANALFLQSSRHEAVFLENISGVSLDYQNKRWALLCTAISFALSYYLGGFYSGSLSGIWSYDAYITWHLSGIFCFLLGIGFIAYWLLNRLRCVSLYSTGTMVLIYPLKGVSEDFVLDLIQQIEEQRQLRTLK